jgi:hypothetical protein
MEKKKYLLLFLPKLISLTKIKKNFNKTKIGFLLS